MAAPRLNPDLPRFEQVEEGLGADVGDAWPDPGPGAGHRRPAQSRRAQASKKPRPIDEASELPGTAAPPISSAASMPHMSPRVGHKRPNERAKPTGKSSGTMPNSAKEETAEALEMVTQASAGQQ